MNALPQFCRRNWFLAGIVLVILLAKFRPFVGCTGGPLKPEITVKYVCVSFIFFNSGVSLKIKDLARALSHVNLHFYIQCFTLIFVPLLMSGLVSLLSRTQLDPWLLKGLLVVGAMPPPVSSAVILTKTVGGNEAGAVFNSAFGSFLGTLVTPMWLLYFLEADSSVSVSGVFSQLSITVIFPLIAGQLSQYLAARKIQRRNIPFGTISSIILLVIIYTTFCDTFTHEEINIDTFSFFCIVLIVILLQVFLLCVTFYLSAQSLFNFLPSDVVACLFCSTHKSLTLGIPILKVMMGSHPELSVISLPLLVYHPTQILLGGLLVPGIRTWMLASERTRFHKGFLSHI